ncbi:MAG: UDP-N-acetylmuramate dehydrogenase [Actinomycetota bacterium]|nr:UDP-N-acetylmuramate dehydrogenase [Actinomycetota bacterium]
MVVDSPGLQHDPVVRDLAAACRGPVEADVNLGDLTTLKVGGPARALLVAECDEDLRAAGEICAANGLPCLIIGRGSNLLVADRGWDGVALTLGRDYRGYRIVGTDVVVAAAEPMPLLATRLADEGLAGFAWAAAVPGSVGGAVRMNAGAHGQDLAAHLVRVDVVGLSDGRRETLAASELGLGYRRSNLPRDSVVVGATLGLQRGDPAAERARIAEVKAWRRAHQPINRPSCGSVFTNPPGDSAGRLVEAAGGRGLRLGGAQVSELHANFIITHPGATASDVRALVLTLQQLVVERQGIRLRPEVVMVGQFEDDAPL